MELKIHDKPPSVCLNMIVKNEEHIIKETLEMLCNKIKFSYWVICDTGSTDNTKEIICKFFEEKQICGEIYDHPWKNFAHNRTLALEMAFNKSDLLFIFDADDEIHGEINIPIIIDSDGYLLNFGSSEGISYQRILLVNNRIKWNYQSVIHEYINCLKPNAKIVTLQGDYYVVSGRRGSRSQDPNKYLKDAKILEEAYNEAKSNNDNLYLRYGFYCANSYKDAGMSEEAIKWYKITLNNDNWSQEKYMSCLNLYTQYNEIGEKEKGFYYLVESLRYDTERMECVYYLINHYLLSGLHNLAYNYYSLIKDFYENKYLLTNNEGKLFIEVDKANLLLPYYMILVCDKVKETIPEAKKTIIKMYEIIFTKKYPSKDEFFIGNLLYNLQFFIEFCISSHGFKELFQSYIDFLQNKLKYNLVKHDFLKKYTKYGVNFECFNISKPSFTLDECKKSNKILFYTGFANLPWNYTYSLNNGLGGSETAVANLSKAFPKNFEIYVCGSVAEEKIDNITYVNLQNIKQLVENTPFHTIIISRYIAFYEMFPETSFYQSYIWGHDISIYHYGCNLDVNSILNKWNSKINGCICQTEWHKNLFIEQYPQLKDKIYTINNGILVDKFVSNSIKVSNRFIYTSCAERGLDRLLELWPTIIENIPDAELFICSYNKFPQNEFESNLNKIIKKYDSIKHVGCLNRDKLYELMSSSEFWLYPTNFNETSCITSMEMLMAEVICIYYPIAGLVNTLGDYGISVERGNELNKILDLTSRQKLSIRKRGKDYAVKCSWINRANEWQKIIFGNNETNNNEVNNIINSDVIFKYGTETINIDITNIVSNRFIKDKHIFIPKGDNYRASIFTDPIFGVKKNIYITDNNNNILQEFSSDEDVLYSLNIDFDSTCIKVINLKRRIDRKNEMINQLEKEEIKNYEIIEAIDGEELNETQELYNLFEGNNFNNRKGVIGCALSHLKLWTQLSQDQNHDFYVILEDDLELSSNFKEKLKKHCELFKKYNLEHLSLGVFDCNDNEQKEIETEDIKVIKKDVYKFWNIAFAYIISKSAAIKIIDFVNKCSIKCAIDNPRSYGDILTHFHTTHCIAKQKNIKHFGTDIQNNKLFSFNFFNKNHTIKIAYCDWWHIEYCGGFFDINNNFITNILRYSNIKNIIVVSPDKNPDILFYSIFGSEHKKYNNVRKIFYSGEPFGPRDDADFNITFNKSSNNNYRYPLWLSYTNNYLLEECNRRKNRIINIPKRSKFCSFISNGECKTTNRREIVEKLSKYKRVDCGGNFLNNIGYTVPRGTNCSGKIEHNNNYKFAIAFENENYPGYVTEKICDIYKSNCIPIYWGNKEVLEDFNPKTFIYANNFTNFDELVDYIIKVDNDDQLYASYFTEPFFSNKWMDILNDPYKTFYKNLADCILGFNLNLYRNFINCPSKNIKPTNDTNLEKIVIYSPGQVYDLIKDYINNLNTRFNVIFVPAGNIELIKNFNPNKILCINNIFDKSILDIFKDIEISILNIDSFIIPYFLQNILTQNSLYKNIKIYDYSETNISILHRNNIFNTEFLEYTYDSKEVDELRKINTQEKIFDFGFICYNKNMLHSKRRKDIIDILISKGFSVNIITGFDKQRDIELGKCRIILNIHQQPYKEIECRTFEHLRCNRLLYAGFNILSEMSFVEPNFILKYPNLKFINYDDFKNISKDNINNFEFTNLEIDKNDKNFSSFENISINLSLENLVNNFLTDKNTFHSYLKTYENILHSKRYSSKNILEIGIQKGGSLKLWNDYFINANIYGLDIDDAPIFLNKYDRIQTFKCSAYSHSIIDMFMKKNIIFDMILDDGPHTIETMLFTLIHYSKLLAPNGILIIEDIPSMDWALLFEKIVSFKYKDCTCIYDLRPNKNRWDDIVFTFTNKTNKPNISVCDVSFYYGIDTIREDLTHVILSTMLGKDYLEIPKGDNTRYVLYGHIDPCPGIVKNIYIKNNKNNDEIIIPHDETFKFSFNKSNINIGIYNIWHNKLFDNCYDDIDDYSLSKITMYDVNQKYNKIYNTNKNYSILREYELENYDKSLQEANYCQTSCLYHIFINNYYKNLDYIGFIQYDMKLYEDFIYSMENKIKNSNNDIYFYSLTVENKIDVKYICKPYDNSILEKYNKYFNTTHTYESIKNNTKSKYFICLHTFVIPVKTYIKMMTWYVSIKDWLHQNYVSNIYQESISEITEEIFGLFLLLQIIEDQNIQLEQLKLSHEWPNLHNQTEWENYKIQMPSNLKEIDNKETYTLSILSIFKNETMNLKIWIEHYLWQGVQHFYLIDNGSTDEPLKILLEYINRGLVTYYYKPEKHRQVEHYKYIFDNENLRYKTKWLCICDLDEFFFGINNTLIETLKEFEDYNIIYTNSHFYGSDNLIEHPNDIRTSIIHREDDIMNGTKYIFKTNSINNSNELWIHWLVNENSLIRKDMKEIWPSNKIRLNHYRIQSYEYFTKVKMTRGDVSLESNENIRDLKYFELYQQIATIKDDLLKNIIENGYKSDSINTITNTALIIETRFLKYLPFVINDFSKKLGTNWKVVFYCGKGLKNIWIDLLSNNNIEIRELDTEYSSYNEYCDILKNKDLWNSLYGDFVLVFSANSYIANKKPFDIDYFISLNKSYIGGNQFYMWRELIRENIYPTYKNFQGGLSLRKRLDMIKIIEIFGTEKTVNGLESKSIVTDAEDVYFTLGCYKLNLPIGDDEICSHFSCHTILSKSFFGANGLEPGYYINLVQQYNDIVDNIYMFKDINSIENESLIVHPGGGFFSNCTVRLFDIIIYFNAVKKLPLKIDDSKLLDLYKDGINMINIFSEYFTQTETVINYEHDINFKENYQYIKYTNLNFTDLNPIITKYFTPSITIIDTIKFIESKYNIKNYDNICVLFYRGNDKISECNLPSYNSFISKAKELYNNNNNLQFLIQSDEVEFIESLTKEFPNNSFYFKDEIRIIKKNNSMSVDHINKITNFKYSKYFLAITIIMSKCQSIICTTGNCSLWISLFRGNANNLYQMEDRYNC